MYSSAYVWAKVLGYMEAKLTDSVISTWFDDTEILELTNSKMILYSPSPFRKDMILQRCSSYIKEAMQELFNTDVELVVLDQTELEDYKNRKGKRTFIDFNPQFTFDTFIVGSSNRFAHAAALSVANNPAKTYNPLFIYGPSGLGKTHLLYAIANEIHKNSPESNIVYVKGDQFTNELIAAIREGKSEEFRGKYRSADLFLIDDIQFIAGKESTQEEFFHTFNALYEESKQIVMTADRPPNEMNRLEDRLKTRFESGLIADIKAPDYETRMAIVKEKANALGYDFPDDVCSYIAENITTNVRQIEGSVKKILAYHDLESMPIDVSNVSRAIKDMYKASGNNLPTPNLIISEVCRFYSIEERFLRGKMKNKNIVEARHVAMYLIRNMTNLSLMDIGHEFDKDHSSVMHGLEKIERMLEDPATGLQDNIRDLKENINSKL